MATASERPCHCQRRRSYKQMVRDIAENLGSGDVQQIVYLHDLPREFGEKSGLEVLQHLERHGEVRERETKQLERLLQEINRFDLIEKHIVQYRRICGCETRTTARGIQAKSAPRQPQLPPLTVTPSPHSHPSLPPILTTRDTEKSASIRLQPKDKHEIHKVITKYVPLDVIINSKVLKRFAPSSRLTRSTECMENTLERDGGCVSRRGGLGSELHEKGKHRSASMSKLQEKKEEEDDLEWVLLDESSVTDSGTCCSSGSSQDEESGSLDIDIGDLSPAQYKSKKRQDRASEKERRYFTWRIRRSEFMVPLFQHTSKTFEKRVKLCMGHKGHCVPIVFKLFPNGVGSDENIYSSFRIALPSASQLVPTGTSLVFSITVRDLRTADILATRYMEVGLEREEYLLEQFIAHEVIKSSQARHFEIRVMTKVNASSRGWVEIQPQKS